MIQATLIFILGFLSAAFLAVLVAPAIWRRAVALTHRRVEAALPLSLNEIRADKDALRAEHAMATRKLEVTLAALREEMAAQSIDADRARDEARRTALQRDEKAATIAELETQQGALRSELVKGEKELARLAELIAERDDIIDEQVNELETLGAMYDQASFDASNRQIELVAQESKLEKLSDELAEAQESRARADGVLNEARAEAEELDKAVRAEKRRIVALERKIEKLTAALSDREEKLERRERDLERLREKLREASESGRDLAARLASAQDRAARLGDELALQARENKALRAVQERKWSAADGAAPDDSPAADGAERVETALLRERIDELAAEMVSLTARIEGPDSGIGPMLGAEPARGKGKRGGNAGPLSLAERIRLLQQAGERKTAGKS